MKKLREQTSEAERPLIILGIGPERWIRGEELTEMELASYMINEKWLMIYDYMVEQGYEKTFENGMFAVYR